MSPIAAARRRWPLPKAIGTLAALTWLSLLAGCSGAVAGDWRLVRAIPSREVLALDAVHFGADSTYSATVTMDGRTVREDGTFFYNGFKLRLRPASGGQRSFDASLSPGKLELKELTRGNRIELRKE